MEELKSKILSKAIATFGKDAQLNMLKEELAELIVAVSHWERARLDEIELAHEIADVYIMIAQLRMMMPKTSSSGLTRIIQFKMNCLSERLDAMD